MSRPADTAYTLVIFSWCPRGGVGSRRWSKFSKYLSRIGHSGRVFTADYPFKDVVNWCHDVDANPRLETIKLPLRYPAWLLSPNRGFWVKLGDRIYQFLTRRTSTADDWAYSIPNALTSHGDNVSPLILTVPPFSLLKVTPTLRKQYPNRKIILDFRDPWKLYTSMKRMVKGGEDYTLEAAALDAASEIWVTTKEHGDYLLEHFGISLEKIILITNGYDTDDYKALSVQQQQFAEHSSDDTYGRVVYPGWVTKKRLKSLIALLKAVKRSGSDTLRIKFEVHILSQNNLPTSGLSPDELKLLKRFVRRLQPVSPQRIPAVISRYTFGLSLDDTESHLRIPIKNFEYLGLQLRIISVGGLNTFYSALKRAGHFVSTADEATLNNLVLDLNRFMAKDGSQPALPHEGMDTFHIQRISETISSQLQANHL